LATVLQREQQISQGNVLRVEWALARSYAEQGQARLAEPYSRRVFARAPGGAAHRWIGLAPLLWAGVPAAESEFGSASEQLDLAEPLLRDEAGPERAALYLERARVALSAGSLDEARRSATTALDQTEATEPGHAAAAYTVLAAVALVGRVVFHKRLRWLPLHLLRGAVILAVDGALRMGRWPR